MNDTPTSKDSLELETLKNISKLPYGWDGDSAPAFPQEVVDNAGKLLVNIIVPNCYDIVLIPNSNMTISIVGKLPDPAIPVLFRVTMATFSMSFQPRDKLEITVHGVFEQSNFDLLNKCLNRVL